MHLGSSSCEWPILFVLPWCSLVPVNVMHVLIEVRMCKRRASFPLKSRQFRCVKRDEMVCWWRMSYSPKIFSYWIELGRDVPLGRLDATKREFIELSSMSKCRDLDLSRPSYCYTSVYIKRHWNTVIIPCKFIPNRISDP